MKCTYEQTYESKDIMQWAYTNDYKGMNRQEIDMTNIKPDNAIVRLINILNLDGIDLEAYCGTRRKRNASSNAAEENLQSSTEAGNINIDTHTNSIVVDNIIQRKASRKEPVKENEVEMQASRQEPEDN